MLREALPEIHTQLPGPESAKMIERRKEALPKVFHGCKNFAMKRAQGAMIEDYDGNRFLDWYGAVGVLNIGYNHPAVVEALKEQSDKYIHCNFGITHEGYVKLAEKLNEIAPVRGDKKRSILINSGSEALENAVKLAKAYTGRPNILVYTGAFHGRTWLTMTMTGKKEYCNGMGPYPDGVYRVEFPNIYRRPMGMLEENAVDYYIAQLERAFIEASAPENIAAIVIEPVQGEGGFIPAPLEYVKKLREICDKYGILLIADEVQCGFARTGTLFRSQVWKENGYAPDILTAAKSLGGGMPISSVTARAELFDAVPGGLMGGTYTGNPMCCAAALAVIETMEKEDFPKKARDLGETVMSAFSKMQEKYPEIGDVRGIGAMIGMEFVKDRETKAPYPQLVSKLVAVAESKGLLLQSCGTFENAIRFLAPLVMTEEQTKMGLKLYEESLQEAIRLVEGGK